MQRHLNRAALNTYESSLLLAHRQDLILSLIGDVRPKISAALTGQADTRSLSASRQ